MELDYELVGKRIKAARKRKGMTQEVLAELAGISASHMSNIETGGSKLSLPTFIALANALSVSADELLCDAIDRSEYVFRKELGDLLFDCDNQELRLIISVVSVFKQGIRASRGRKN